MKKGIGPSSRKLDLPIFSPPSARLTPPHSLPSTVSLSACPNRATVTVEDGYRRIGTGLAQKPRSDDVLLPPRPSAILHPRKVDAPGLDYSIQSQFAVD